MSKLLLIDGNSLMFRAYYSTAYSGRMMKRKDGFATNAIHGFINMMTKVEKDFDYTHILVAFDAGKKTFRHDKLTTYKEGRVEMPDDFRAQIPFIKQYLDLMNIKRHQVDGYEADDIIGTLATKGCAESFKSIEIITGDKDLLQLVNDCVTVHITRKGVTELESYTPAGVAEKYGLEPARMVDLKGLMGDASDNLPGIPGVGEKTAIKLLARFGTVENLLANTDQLKGKQKENVEAHGDQALLCKEMAKILCDMEDVPEIGALGVIEKDAAGLQQFFMEMEFNAFLRNLKMTHAGEPQTEGQITIMRSVAELDAKTFGESILHVEIFGDNYHKGEVVGIGVLDDSGSYYVPFEIAKSSTNFLSFLGDPTAKKSTFDLKRATVALKWQAISLAGITNDLLLKAYVLDPSTSATELAKVAMHYGYDDISYEEEVYGKGAKKQIPEAEIVAGHVDKKMRAIKILQAEMSEKLKETGQWGLYAGMEMPLAEILAEMEFEGIKLDVSILKEMSEDFKSRIAQLEADIHELAGQAFNVASPKQLGPILFESLGLPGKKTKSGSYSTSADILEKLRDKHPIIEKILSYRTLTKLYSTYIEGLQKSMFDDGKIHTIFNQALTQTGRLSSVDPNVQNIPIRLEEGRLIRKAFVASGSDRVLIAADYSQIELRVLAHLSQTEGLITAFQEDLDVHTLTAAEVFDVELEEVTEAQRRGAKAINFGIVYGQSAYGLSEALGISMVEAKKYIEGYLETYSGVQAYMDDTIKGAREDGFVTTLFNRRRYIPDIEHKNFMVRQMAERTAINAPVQGTAADIIKIAMIEVDKLMKAAGARAKMVLQVHDELLFDVPVDELELMSEMIVKAMEGATKLAVPLKADVSSGKSWFEAK